VRPSEDKSGRAAQALALQHHHPVERHPAAAGGHRDVGCELPSSCSLLLLASRSLTALTVLSQYCDDIPILCAIPTTAIHCSRLCLFAFISHRLIDRGQSSPRRARAPARALSTHPTPSDHHQSPSTHSLSLLHDNYNTEHTHTRYDIPEKYSSLCHFHCYRSLSPVTHAYTPHQSPDRLYSALSSRSRSETASIPACFACQHLTHPALQPAIN
jgi:hypothetical protein